MPYDPQRGNYPTIRKSGFTTKDQAFQAMTKAIAEMNNGKTKLIPMNVDDYLEEWLTQIKDKNLGNLSTCQENDESLHWQYANG